MNTAIRAYRILSNLANYQKVGPGDEWPSKLANEHLGEAIGCYRNSPEHGSDLVGVFSNGVAWLDHDRKNELRFVEIAEVTLPSKKESEGLLLRTQDGRELFLPIRGRRGRFFDSLEVLRFFDRVIKDLKS